MLKAGDQVGFHECWMRQRNVLFTAEVICVPNENVAVLSCTGFWGPLKGQCWSIQDWFTHPLSELHLLDEEELAYVKSVD